MKLMFSQHGVGYVRKCVYALVVCATLITAYICARVCVCVCAVCSVSVETQQRLVSRKKTAVKGRLFVTV